MYVKTTHKQLFYLRHQRQNDNSHGRLTNFLHTTQRKPGQFAASSKERNLLHLSTFPSTCHPCNCGIWRFSWIATFRLKPPWLVGLTTEDYRGQTILTYTESSYVTDSKQLAGLSALRCMVGWQVRLQQAEATSGVTGSRWHTEHGNLCNTTAEC